MRYPAGRENGKFIHGHNGAKGKTGTYTSWESMMRRCSSHKFPRFKDYGGRGIKVCERWKKFNNFLCDMGERPKGTTLDRYPNNNGDYEPGNCRWATSYEQSRNRNKNVVVEFQGKSAILRDWARELRIPWTTFYYRYRRGAWPPNV